MALEDLARYEFAAVSKANYEKRPDLALTAIDEFYKSNKQLLEEPFAAKYLPRALQDSQEALQHGGGVALDIINAANIYGKKYNENFVKSKISDLVSYLSISYLIPEKAKESILKYADSTYEDLVKKAQDKETPKEELESIQKALGAIEVLKKRRMELAGLNVLNKYTTAVLDELYPKSKEEGEEK